MSFRPFRLFPAAWLALAAAVCACADVPAERAAASFLLSTGRDASAAELADWTRAGELPFPELLARLRRLLHSDPALLQTVARRAAIDSFGRAATPAEIAAGAAGGEVYFEQVQRNLRALAGDPAEYQRMLERAYRLLLARPPYAEEVEYWRARPVLPFALLVACIENWARRNAPGLTATSGTPSVSIGCPYLTTVRLSPAVAAEARRAIGLDPAGGPELAATLGRHLVAPGAAEIVTVGRMHFAAAGSAWLFRPESP